VLFALRDVCLTRSGQPVLRDVSAEIRAGSTAVLGPSGSGKSTLLRLLNRLADPEQGEIDYRGEPLRSLDPLALRREVALVPQLPALLDGTVEGNLRFAADLAGRDLDGPGCLGLAGLDGSFGERDVAKLSVGEQQRVMLARALAQAPKVLLLDEPTSALDEATRDAVELTLMRLRSELDVSLILVTHDPAQARRLGDHIIRLAAGRVVECGPASTVGVGA